MVSQVLVHPTCGPTNASFKLPISAEIEEIALVAQQIPLIHLYSPLGLTRTFSCPTWPLPPRSPPRIEWCLKLASMVET